jgi:hypothetical protein
MCHLSLTLWVPTKISVTEMSQMCHLKDCGSHDATSYNLVTMYEYSVSICMLQEQKQSASPTMKKEEAEVSFCIPPSLHFRTED